MSDHCAVPRCRRDVEIVYLGRALCGHHWDELAAEEPAAMEGPMESTNETVSETTETKPAAKDAAPEETMAAKKKSAKKKTEAKDKKAVKAATAKPKKEKTPREPKPQAEKPARVFAFRLTDDELAAIHRIAGPRNATRLIRAVAAAFAAEDEGAFKAVLRDAREARS